MTQREPAEQRLDAWLWCARFARTRARAAAIVEEGHVRINRRPTAKPHARLRRGDVLTLPLGQTVRVVTVKALTIRRGPRVAAMQLYEEIPEVTGFPATGSGGAEEA